MAQPIRTFDIQSWNARPHSNDPSSSRTARRDVQVFGNAPAGLMSAVLHLLMEHVCQEPQDAKRLFRYLRLRLQKYLENTDQQFQPGFDKPQAILLKNELNRVISEVASQAKIAIHHDRIFPTEIGIVNPLRPDVSKYYLPDLREAQTYCENNFTFVCEIGRGGFGVVNRMRNKVDNVEYAVKKIELDVMTADGNNQKSVAHNEKIRKEVLILAALDHPNIVRYHSTWTQHRVIRGNVFNLQRALSLQTTPHLGDEHSVDVLSDACGDRCSSVSAEPLVIEEVKGAAGSPARVALAPALKKGDKLTADDFKRAPNQFMWSSDWSDDEQRKTQEGEEEKAENDRNGTPFGETKDFGISSVDSEQSERAIVRIVRNGAFAKSSTVSNSVVRSQSENGNCAVLQTTLFIQMQLCDLSLKDWLSARASSPDIRVDRQLCMDIFEQAVRGVAYLHNHHLIHRDIKPANILLIRRPDEGLLVKLADFGLSRYLPNVEEAVSEELQDTEMSSKIGTLFYAAPEQRSGCQYGKEADMYSLGLILFELFRPCGSESELVMVTATLRDTPVRCPPDFLSSYPDVAVLVCRLLHKDPQQRLSAHDLLREGCIMGKEWMRKEILALKQEVEHWKEVVQTKDDRISHLEKLLRTRQT